jgi:hypothetical protein
VVKDRHPIAHGEGSYISPNGRNRAHGFMAEDARSGVRPGMDLLQVGATDATAMNLDEHFVPADRGHWNGLDTDVVHATIDRGLHVSRHSERVLLLNFRYGLHHLLTTDLLAPTRKD